VKFTELQSIIRILGLIKGLGLLSTIDYFVSWEKRQKRISESVAVDDAYSCSIRFFNADGREGYVVKFKVVVADDG